MPLMLNSKFLYSSQYSVDSSSNTLDALGLPSLRIDLGNHYKPEIKVLTATIPTQVWQSTVLGPHSNPLCQKVYLKGNPDGAQDILVRKEWHLTSWLPCWEYSN